jgi:hypothetical protein
MVRQSIGLNNRSRSRKRKAHLARSAGSLILDMKRLPSYDIQTSRAEQGLFLSLSMAAVAILAITASDAVHFAGHRQEIAAVISIESATIAAIKTNSAITNLTVLQSGAAGERARLGGPAAPKS